MARQASSLQRPILCAVLDATALGSAPRAFSTQLFETGVDWIQLRDRSLESEALYEVALELVAGRDAARATIPGDETHAEDRRDPPRVLLNRRADIALACGADGVHLGFDAIDPASARELLGADAVIGASFHEANEVGKARGSELSYAHLAPIWNPISKPASRPPLGLEALAQAAAFGLPILAQGGLDDDRARQAIEAGAAGIAVTGLLGQADDPCAAANTLRRVLDRISSPAG
jgi:thiamine-phosphate pyrophosphorylase